MEYKRNQYQYFFTLPRECKKCLLLCNKDAVHLPFMNCRLFYYRDVAHHLDCAIFRAIDATHNGLRGTSLG